MALWFYAVAATARLRSGDWNGGFVPALTKVELQGRQPGD
jgi:hypothetical protein